MADDGPETRGRITAEELMAELERDPAYAEGAAAREREQRRRVSEWRRAEAPLVKELRAAGFEVNSAWDLVNTAQPYPDALPILVAHLARPYPDRV